MAEEGFSGVIMQPIQPVATGTYAGQPQYTVVQSEADGDPDTPPSKRVARVMSGTGKTSRFVC